MRFQLQAFFLHGEPTASETLAWYGKQYLNVCVFLSIQKIKGQIEIGDSIRV